MHYMEIRGLARKFRFNPTEAEKELWKYLRKRNLSGRRFLRQHPVIYQVVDHDCFFFIADFYCDSERLIIELDGKVHDERIEKDSQRDLILKSLGLRVLHIKNDELVNMEEVLAKIRQEFI